LYKDKERKVPIVASPSTTLASVGIGHGDLIFLIPINGAVLTPDSMEGMEFAGESSSGNISASSSLTSLRAGKKNH